MKLIDRILGRLASPADRALLEPPTFRARLSVTARIVLRYFWLYLILLVVASAWVSAAGMEVYHKTESPEMCKGCHEMGVNFKSWANSRHHAIKCVDCHANPGLAGWVAAKTGGLVQLYTHLTVEKVIHDDIELKPKHEDIVSRNCARCHTGSARVSELNGRRLAHARHTEVGVACIECHSGRVAHPSPKDSVNTYVGLADTDACFSCHDGKHKINGPKGVLTAFGLTDEGSCTKCHPDSKHAVDHFGKDPRGATLKPCLECHEHKEGSRHYLLDHNNLKPMCAKCHQRVNEPFVSKHKPFADGNCSSCHQVMAPAYLFKNGPEPTKEFCLSCHSKVAGALALPKATTVTNFSDDGSDLHASHAKDIENPGQRMCLSCHDGHGSAAAKAMIFLRPKEKGGEAGKFEATPDGGKCSGSCHGDDEMSYSRGGGGDEDEEKEEPKDAKAAPAAPAPAKGSDEDEEE